MQFLLTQLSIWYLEILHNYPFRVLDDEKMEETAGSIKQYGVLVLGIARPSVETGISAVEINIPEKKVAYMQKRC